MLRHPRPFVLVIALIACLFAGGSTAQAEKTRKLFRPDQPPLSETDAVRAAKNQIDKLERVRNVGKNYVRSASATTRRSTGRRPSTSAMSGGSATATTRAPSAAPL